VWASVACGNEPLGPGVVAVRGCAQVDCVHNAV